MFNLDVSIIIVNYKTPKLLFNCISSILRFTKDLSFEIIVVDNDSKDGSEELIKNNFSKVKYIQSCSNLGFGKANNLGVKNSKGRNILFLNSDTLLINNAIKILSDYLDSKMNVGVCGGNLYDENKNHIHSYSHIIPGIFSELDALFSNYISKAIRKKTNQFNITKKPSSVAYICGADMMIKSNLFKNLNGFDNDFFLYFEETELSYRVLKVKLEIHNVPKAKIIHLEGGSQINSRKKLTYYNKSRKLFYRKRYANIKYYTVCLLFYLKCILGLTKNLLFFNKNKIQNWYYNIITF